MLGCGDASIGWHGSPTHPNTTHTAAQAHRPIPALDSQPGQPRRHAADGGSPGIQHTTPNPRITIIPSPSPNPITHQSPPRHEQKLEDAYQVLGLEEDASEVEVKKAYRKQALVRLRRGRRSMLAGMDVRSTYTQDL